MQPAIHGVPFREQRPALPALPLPEPPLMRGALCLRPFRTEDAAALAAASRDTDLAHYTSLPANWHEADAAAWIERAELARQHGHSLCLAISDQTSDLLLGGVSLIALDRAECSAEIGYWLTAQARGRGAAATATSLLGDWTLATLGVDRLQLHIDPANGGSVALAKRCGYRLVGSLPPGWFKGEWIADGLWERH
jgi:RimJ/RimL family protein N-acetyltransferase